MHDQVSTDDESDESDDSDKLPITVSSTTEADPSTEQKDCVVCLEEFTVAELTEAPCGHSLCQTCIIRFVEQSMADEALFPPQCCQQAIPITANAFLSEDLVDLFEKKRVEYGTLNRTYCSNPYCLKFIPPLSIEDDTATCQSCQNLTCVICKATAHDGLCGGDTETQALLALAADLGWKRCTECGRMIELVVGCNSMQCICGFEFCYVCGIAASEECDCTAYGIENAQVRTPEVCRHRWFPLDISDDEECDGCDKTTTVQACQHCMRRLCAACRRRWPVGI